MSRAFFLSLPDWAKLTEEIKDQIRCQTEGALSPPPINADSGIALATKEYYRGWVDALKHVLDLPNQILKDGDHEGEEKASQQEEEVVEGVRSVPARQPPRRITGIH